MCMNNNLIGCKVKVKDDVDYIGGWEGVVVGDVGVGEGECVYGRKNKSIVGEVWKFLQPLL